MQIFFRYSPAIIFFLYSLKVLILKQPSIEDAAILLVATFATLAVEYFTRKDNDKQLNSRFDEQNNKIKELESKIQELVDVKNYLSALKLSNNSRGINGSR